MKRESYLRSKGNIICEIYNNLKLTKKLCRGWRRGFTLVELLVVIAIIGVLASVVLSSLNSARVKGRDANRDSDIHQINNALALYYDDYQKYPDTTGPTKSNNAADWAVLGTELTPYMQTLPIDPLNNSSYYYTYETTDVLSSDYTLTANYERQPVAAEAPASIVEFKHQYVAAEDPTGYSFAAPAQVGDVVLIAVQGQNMNTTHSTVRDSLGNTYTERLYAKAAVWTEITIFTATVTTPGEITLYVTSTNDDIGFSAYLLHGYESAIPNASASSVNVITTPSTISFATTQQTSVFMFYANEQADTFVSWTEGITGSNHEVGHVDAAGYQLGTPAGSITLGYNLIGTNNRSVLVGVAIPE